MVQECKASVIYLVDQFDRILQNDMLEFLVIRTLQLMEESVPIKRRIIFIRVLACFSIITCSIVQNERIVTN